MTDTAIDSTADEIPAEPEGAGLTDPSVAVAVVEPAAGAIIRAEQPEDIIANATKIANVLKGLIDGQGLAVSVGGNKKHVEVGAWQACGAMLGALGGQPLHAETVWTRKVTGDDGLPIRTNYTATVKRYFKRADGGGLREEITYDVDGYDWEACVEIRTPSGVVVGRAEAMCSRAEETWSRRDDYAVRAMAETRAEGRAYRRAIGWIVHLAGYSPTPAEEMGHTPGADTQAAPPHGPQADPALATAASTAVLDFADGDREAGLERWAAIKRACDNYLPHAVGMALCAAAGTPYAPDVPPTT